MEGAIVMMGLWGQIFGSRCTNEVLFYYELGKLSFAKD